MTAVMTDVWTPVCRLGALLPERGVCALVGDRHVAVFRLSSGDEIVAVDNVDPFTGASVLSRGLVGSIESDGDAVIYVASPLRKQRFDLRTGRCLDDADVALDVFEVAVTAGGDDGGGDGGVVVVRYVGGPAGDRSPRTGSRWGNEPETTP